MLEEIDSYKIKGTLKPGELSCLIDASRSPKKSMFVIFSALDQKIFDEIDDKTKFNFIRTIKNYIDEVELTLSHDFDVRSEFK